MRELTKPCPTAENFSALTRLDHNRAVGQLALKAGAAVEDVTGCIIWGNHSSTQYPDINSATIKGESKLFLSFERIFSIRGLGKREAV